MKSGPGSCISERAQVGNLPGSDEASVDLPIKWVPILHLDIKMENFLLETPEENADYPAYPKPVLCDFGLSHLATPEFVTARSGAALNFIFSGTKGWQPPVGAADLSIVTQQLTTDT